ncbi:hypothetical protein, partial [Desulfamplus magnetovallimortis]|uniref:hypothetical protein n=1 Tax=Desulfamplus magnetovallimortis TaxID=1246637 RepID=UPI0009BBB886
MSDKKFLTASMLAKELGSGKATIKFLLNRFNRWLPYSMKNGQKLYEQSVLDTLIIISEQFESGTLPSEIETVLEGQKVYLPDISKQTALSNTNAHSGQPQNNESSVTLSDILKVFTAHQERIALAEERRALAEEKKAEALSKRAEAESLKAVAIEHLAEKIESISSTIISSFLSVTSNKETLDSLNKSSDNLDHDHLTPDSLSSSKDTDPSTADQPIDNEPLIDNNTETDESITDNSEGQLSDDISFSDELDDPILQGFEDLSHFIEDEVNSDDKKDKFSPTDTPDLPEQDGSEDSFFNSDSSNENKAWNQEDQVREPWNTNQDDEEPWMKSHDYQDVKHKADVTQNIDISESDIDDLSALIDENTLDNMDIKDMESDNDLDNLSALIDDSEFKQNNDFLNNNSEDKDTIDDLAALIDDQPLSRGLEVRSDEIDDLSTLIDDKKKVQNLDQETMDDLASL